MLLAAGGLWDLLEHRYVLDEDGKRVRPKTGKVVPMEESQAPFTRWYAQEFLARLRCGEPRDVSLALAAGDRRGGKTFDLLLVTLATLLDVPTLGGSPTVGWAVSAEYGERDELDRTVREHIPSSWYTYKKSPQFEYTFLPGSYLRNLSAYDPEMLKRGRVDVAFYNEAQKMPMQALTNGIYGTADKGGIALLAANPPRRQRGEWVYQLKQAIDEDLIAGVKYFGFSSKENTQIDAAARSRVGGIVRVLDPKGAAADDEGLWSPVNDRAYYEFKPKVHGVSLPEYLPDLPVGAAPVEVTATFIKRRYGRAFAYCGGVDFQGTPHHAGVIGRLFGNEVEPSLLIVQEFLVDLSTEDDFLDEIDEAGYTPETLLWAGDASGQWQDGKHNFSGGRASFDIFKRRRWHIRPPIAKKTDRGEHSRNPKIEDRLGLANRLLKAGRVRIDRDACPKLMEALRECPVQPGRYGGLSPYGLYSHLTDAASYMMYYLFPPKREMASGGKAPPGATFPGLKPGGGMYQGY